MHHFKHVSLCLCTKYYCKVVIPSKPLTVKGFRLIVMAIAHIETQATVIREQCCVNLFCWKANDLNKFWQKGNKNTCHFWGSENEPICKNDAITSIFLFNKIATYNSFAKDPSITQMYDTLLHPLILTINPSFLCVVGITNHLFHYWLYLESL